MLQIEIPSMLAMPSTEIISFCFDARASPIGEGLKWKMMIDRFMASKIRH